MNRAFARFAYRLLLSLHPASFQDEFGSEMLWIFDEEFSQGGAAYMFLDGVISLLRQCSRIEKDPGQLSIASGEIITGPGLSPVRLLQAGVPLSLIVFSLIHLGSHPSPFTLSVRWSAQVPCYTITLQAPSHAEVVLESTP
jgi:hypothetical protein